MDDGKGELSGMDETPMRTEEAIRPIVISTYGDDAMSRALVVHLAEQINKWPDVRAYRGRSRESMICMVCWDWFSGGSTAEAVAKEIEATLTAPPAHGASRPGASVVLEFACPVCLAKPGEQCVGGIYGRGHVPHAHRMAKYLEALPRRSSRLCSS